MKVAFSEEYSLSPHSRDDAPEIVKHLSDREISDNLRKVPNPYTLKDAYDWFDRYDEEKLDPETSPIRFAIRENASGKMIGDLAVRHLKDRTFFVGYWLAKEYWGKGIMSNALKAVLDIVRSEYPKVEKLVAGARIGNWASRRVLEKNGFRFTGEHFEGSLTVWTFEMQHST